MAYHTFSGIEHLKAGQRLKIKGKFLPTGEFLALEVKHKPDKNLLEFEGLLQEVLDGGRAVRIFNRVISLPADLTIKSPQGQSLTPADLQPEDYVKIKFQERAGEWVPFKIKLRERRDFIVEELQGPVQQVDVSAGEMVVEGIRVKFSDDTTVEL